MQIAQSNRFISLKEYLMNNITLFIISYNYIALYIKPFIGFGKSTGV